MLHFLEFITGRKQEVVHDPLHPQVDGLHGFAAKSFAGRGLIKNVVGGFSPGVV